MGSHKDIKKTQRASVNHLASTSNKFKEVLKTSKISISQLINYITIFIFPNNLRRKEQLVVKAAYHLAIISKMYKTQAKIRWVAPVLSFKVKELLLKVKFIKINTTSSKIKWWYLINKEQWTHWWISKLAKL